MSDEPFYAVDRMIFQQPATVVRPDGTTSITRGFLVCTVGDSVAADGVAHVARLLNAGHAALAAAETGAG